MLHYLAPAGTFAWWLAFAPKQRLRLSAPLIWALWPIIYVVYAVARGQVDGVYPYPFLDLGALGWSSLVANVSGLFAAFTGAGFGLRALARILSR